MRTEIKAVIFDIANTLLDKPLLFPEMLKVLRDFNILVPLAELAERHRWLSEVVIFPDRTNREFYDDFNATLVRSFGISPSAALVDSIYKACSYLPWQPFGDTNALQHLELPIGALSNWNNELWQSLTLLTGVEFDWVLGSEDAGVRKPDPEFFHMMLDTTGLRPGELAFVGDSLRLDIEPASSIGMSTFLLDREDLYPYSNVRRLRSLAELKAAL